MARFPQGPREKGSHSWIQRFVNHAPDVLEQHIGLGAIEWRSPLGIAQLTVAIALVSGLSVAGLGAELSLLHV